MPGRTQHQPEQTCEVTPGTRHQPEKVPPRVPPRAVHTDTQMTEETIGATVPDTTLSVKIEEKGKIVTCATMPNKEECEASNIVDEKIVLADTNEENNMQQSTENIYVVDIVSDNENIPNVSILLSQTDSSVGRKSQLDTCVESGVSKIKKQFESCSQVTSPVLDSDRAAASGNNASAALAKLKNLVGINEDGKKTNNVEDKIKKFNEASNLRNTQTLIRSKRSNSVRTKDQPCSMATKESVTSPPPYDRNVRSADTGDVPNVSGEKIPPSPVSDLAISVKDTDAAQKPEMYLYHQKSQNRKLDKAKSVDEAAVKHVHSKNLGPNVSFSSFKSSHSSTEILHQVQTREVKQLQAQFNSKAGPAVTELGVDNEISGGDQLSNVKLKSSIRQLIKSVTPQLPRGEQIINQETLIGVDHRTEQVEHNSSDGKILFKTCKKKSGDSIPTVPGSSYFTGGSEEIWLVKKKDIEAMEDKMIQALFKGEPKPVIAAPIKEQEKIDFLNRPVSTCKSFRRSPVPSNSKETRQQKDSPSNPKDSEKSVQEMSKNQEHFSHNTETRRSKRFFQFRSESVDPQAKGSADVAKSQTLKRQTSVSCTCGQDKKLRSKSQGEPIPSPRTPHITQESKEPQKQKTRSRSQGATDDVQNRVRNPCSQKSPDGVQQRSNLLYREVYNSQVQSEEDIYEKYETLV